MTRFVLLACVAASGTGCGTCFDRTERVRLDAEEVASFDVNGDRAITGAECEPMCLATTGFLWVDGCELVRERPEEAVYLCEGDYGCK